MIKKNFLTGLVLLLPVVVTVWIVLFFINLLTAPFLQLVVGALRHYEIFHPGLGKLADFLIKLLIILFLILITTGIGLAARAFVAHYFIRMGDYVIHQIPIVNRIYKAAQEVVKNLFKEERKTFSQVVLVPFPCEKSYSIGFVTQKSEGSQNSENTEELLSIFVPATPNPTMGFLILVPKQKVIFLKIAVDEALKAIISCGIVIPKIHPLP